VIDGLKNTMIDEQVCEHWINDRPSGTLLHHHCEDRRGHIPC
jgi:hypothetical protein